jgi:hypothetical protein
MQRTYVLSLPAGDFGFLGGHTYAEDIRLGLASLVFMESLLSDDEMSYIIMGLSMSQLPEKFLFLNQFRKLQP